MSAAGPSRQRRSKPHHGACPLCLRKQTCATCLAKSASCPEPTYTAQQNDVRVAHYSITSSARRRNESWVLWLELRGFGNKLAELIRRVTTHSRGPRIA